MLEFLDELWRFILPEENFGCCRSYLDGCIWRSCGTGQRLRGRSFFSTRCLVSDACSWHFSFLSRQCCGPGRKRSHCCAAQEIALRARTRSIVSPTCNRLLLGRGKVRWMNLTTSCSTTNRFSSLSDFWKPTSQQRLAGSHHSKWQYPCG